MLKVIVTPGTEAFKCKIERHQNNVDSPIYQQMRYSDWIQNFQTVHEHLTKGSQQQITVVLIWLKPEEFLTLSLNVSLPEEERRQRSEDGVCSWASCKQE